VFCASFKAADGAICFSNKIGYFDKSVLYNFIFEASKPVAIREAELAHSRKLFNSCSA